MLSLLENFAGHIYSDIFTQLDKLALQNLHYYVHIKDREGKYLDCNQRLLDDITLTRNDLLGSTDLDFPFLPEHQANLFRKSDCAVMASEISQYFIEPLTLRDHKEYICVSQKSPYYSTKKKPIGSIAFSLVLLKQKEMHIPVVNDAEGCSLTERQIDCLVYLVKGMTMKQIAATLNLSPKTVEHYLEIIKDKLDCQNRSELVAKALSYRIIREKIL